LEIHRFQIRCAAAAVLITSSLLLLTGCQGLVGASNGAGTVGVASGNLDFGLVPVGTSKTLPDTLSNNTTSSITVSSIQGLGSGFQITGITLPLAVAAGKSVPFNVQFQPTDPGDPTATISFIGQNAQSYVSVVASGNGVLAGNLSLNPAQIAFGSVKVGSNQTSTVTLSNNGSADLTITQATMSGAGFSMSNLSLPLTLHVGNTASATITFAPTGGGNFSGSASIATTSNGINDSIALSFSGAGVAASGVLSPNPSSLSFGTVQVGNNSSLSETLTNTGGSALTISQATMTGAGFSISGLSVPVTVAAGQSISFHVAFAPTSAGAASGALSVVSDGLNSPLNISLSGIGVAAGALTASPSSANFGSVTVGNKQTVPVTVTNTGGTTVTVSRATASGSGFSFTGPSLPVTLNGGQSTSFGAIFTPSATGAASGTLTINSNANNATLSVALSGTGVAAGQLVSNPSSLSFGNIQVGASKSLSGTLTNSGGTSLTISAATASGSGFSLSGLTLPLTLSAGQSTSFTVLFSPKASGAVSGSVSITSTGSNSTLSVPLSGAGVAAGTLAANPTSLAFGSVQVGNSANLAETLTNTGESTLTLSAAAASGSGFGMSGLALPLTLSAGQSTSFTVVFSPTASGAASGTVNITSNGSNPTLSIPLSGTGVAPGKLTANPASLAFGSVQVGNSTNLSETLTNTGGSTVTVSQANLTGAVFSISGLTVPLTLTAGQSVTFTARFAPASAGAASGSLSVVSNASNSPLSIALSGTGTAAGQLAVSPTTLSFGNVTVGSNSVLSGSLTASGGSVTVSSASLINSEFVLSGISLPVTLGAAQSATFTVTFTPGATGATSGTVSFSSNASNSPALQSLTGTGTAPTPHTVDLTWNPSSSAVGYNIYRGSASGGPYTMINPLLDVSTAYTDNTVVSGQTYYYVATAVDSGSNESAYSSQVQAVIPSP
jgi:hypothetical protein